MTFRFRVNYSKMICSRQLESRGFQRYRLANGLIAVIKKSRKLVCNPKAWNAVSNHYCEMNEIMKLKAEIFDCQHFFCHQTPYLFYSTCYLVSSTLPVSQQPPLTPNKKTEQHSPPSNILQSYNRQINADSDKFKQEEVNFTTFFKIFKIFQQVWNFLIFLDSKVS